MNGFAKTRTVIICDKNIGTPILVTGMDYEKMKALMQTSRQESTAQRNPEGKEFPKSDSSPDWKYLDYTAKRHIAAWKECI